MRKFFYFPTSVFSIFQLLFQLYFPFLCISLHPSIPRTLFLTRQHTKDLTALFIPTPSSFINTAPPPPFLPTQQKSLAEHKDTHNPSTPYLTETFLRFYIFTESYKRKIHHPITLINTAPPPFSSNQFPSTNIRSSPQTRLFHGKQHKNILIFLSNLLKLLY